MLIIEGILNNIQCTSFCCIGINSISCYDVCETGVPDILLGRDDGVVEVFSMDENNQPKIQFTHVRSPDFVLYHLLVLLCLSPILIVHSQFKGVFVFN